VIFGITDLEEEESESQLANSRDCELPKRTCGSIILQIPVGIKRSNLVQGNIERSCNKTVNLRADRVGRLRHFLKNKSEAFENFKIYKEMVENEMDSRIKCLRYDNGGEFTSNEYMDYCMNHGIKRQFSVARTPQHNGVYERKNRTVQEITRTMLMDSKFIDIFWT
jgi:hypothetical protein